MRRGALIFVLVNLCTVSFLVYQVRTPLALLFANGATDALSRTELPAPDSALIDSRPRLIPKIIHQTYKNTSIPAHWVEPQRSCIELHPDYEYKVSVALGW